MQGGSRTASGTAPTTPAGPGNGNTPGGPGLPLNVPASGGHAQEGPGGGRQNLGQSPNMAAGLAGQHNSVNNQGSAPSSGTHQIGPNIHHYRGLIPPFVSLLLDLERSMHNMRNTCVICPLFPPPVFMMSLILIMTRVMSWFLFLDV